MAPHDGLASVHIIAGRALEEKQQMTEAVEEYRLYFEKTPMDVMRSVPTKLSPA
jgi:hypothetical protein